MKLGGSQLKAFREALIDAFPDDVDLEEMVLDELDEQLNTITQGKDYRTTVRKFVEWGEAQGRLTEIVIGAAIANPGNPRLQTFIQDHFEPLLESPEPLPDLTQTLLPILKSLSCFQCAITFCRLNLPGIRVHRSHWLDQIEDSRLSDAARWLIVLELLLHAYPQIGDKPTIVMFVDFLQQQPDLLAQSRSALATWLTQLPDQYKPCPKPNQATPMSDSSTTALQGYLPIIVKSSNLMPGQFLVHGFLVVKPIGQEDDQQPNLIPIETLSGSSANLGQDHDQIAQKGAACSLTEIETQLPNWIRSAKAYLSDQSLKWDCSFDLTVEFFLPYEYLATAVDLWQIQAVIARRERSEPIGKRHRVVVRSVDRLEDPDLLNNLLRVWQQVTLLLAAQPEMPEIQAEIQAKIRSRCYPLLRLDARSVERQLPVLKQHFAVKLACVLPQQQAAQADLFALLLESGVPIALWTRQVQVAHADLDQEFDQLLAPECLCNLELLLEQVRQKRENAHIEDCPCDHLGYHLGLLCDEPTRLGQLNRFIKDNQLWGRSV